MAETERAKEMVADVRASKVLALRTDSLAMTEALEAIGEFYDANTLDARQALRQNLELRTVEYGKLFLQQMDAIREQLEAVDDYASHLYESCQNLASKVEDADRNIKSFMEQASQLEAKKTLFLAQSEEVSQFLSKYHMNQNEIQLLKNARLDNSADARAFHATFAKLQQAYKDCKAITEKQFYGIGFELLDVLGRHQETAYDKLFQWLKEKCEILAEEGQGASAAFNNTQHITYLYAQLQTAAKLLREVPAYFEQCQDLLIAARRGQLVQRFMQISVHGYVGSQPLQGHRGGPTGTAVGLDDAQSNDPVSFLSGLLAWIHQSFALEREFFDVILSSNPKESNTNNSNSSGTYASVYTLDELLVRAVQGLGRPLRMRVLTLLEAQHWSLDLLYALGDLLLFYQQTFQRLLPLENAVHAALKGSGLECERLFALQLRKLGEAAKLSTSSFTASFASAGGGGSAAGDSSLRATTLVRETAQQVRALLRVAQQSLLSGRGSGGKEVSDGAATPSGFCDLESAVGDLLQPVLQACRFGAQQSGLSPVQVAVFMLNNVSVLQSGIFEDSSSSPRPSVASSAGSSAAATTSWEALLQREWQTWKEVLVAEEVQHLLQSSGLDRLADRCESLPPSGASPEVLQQAGLAQEQVAQTLGAFYASLFATAATSHVEQIQTPATRELVHREIQDGVVRRYALVHEMVVAQQQAYGYDVRVLQQSVEGVRLLLGNL